MENFIASRLTANQPALNPFAGFVLQARTAVELLAELQHPEGKRGRGNGLSVFDGASG